MKIPVPLAIRRGAPAWAPAARAATQGRPYDWAGAPTVYLHSLWCAAGSWKLRGFFLDINPTRAARRRCLSRQAALELVFDERLEQRAVTQGGVHAARGAQQRDRPAGGQGGQPLDDLGARTHLREVAPLVFRHTDGRPMFAVVVRVELAAGASVGDPLVPRLAALGQGARAVAADEDAVPVGGRARIVPALDADAHDSMI